MDLMTETVEINWKVCL